MTTPDELRERLSSLAEAADHDAPDAAAVYQRASREAQRRRRQSRVTAAAAALILGVVGVAALISASGDGNGVDVSTDPEPTIVEDPVTEPAPVTEPVPVTTAPVTEPRPVAPEIVLGPSATGVSVGAPIPVEGNPQV
ncbi:MAG: hypothetical protein HKN26_15800, partial [Acidimicrobiales bacterium]|nr:hypothetical protein [Acidimicrobiales bacterium]